MKKAWVIWVSLNSFNKLIRYGAPSTNLSSMQPLQLLLLGLPSDGSLDSSGQLGIQFFFCVGFLAQTQNHESTMMLHTQPANMWGRHP